jgi:phage-related protein
LLRKKRKGRPSPPGQNACKQSREALSTLPRAEQRSSRTQLNMIESSYALI